MCTESHDENETTLNFNYYYEFLKELDEKNKEEIKADYESCGPKFRTALDKFSECLPCFKIEILCSFLYDINQNIDPTRVKSGAMIRVQVESVKRCKRVGSSSTKQASGKEI
ncbi:unnamed protein product [Rhizophagus irregularis]|uniref:Uncharacterized protein n=1 Tax=Rhizophagus irregularis TaxID=588596 RepID=A0A916EKM1_9GLOM|nr:unnamed protein product [Rhizophagus irregularis]CAB5200413.1 unnamed protein product [Rhizophagus irregularis]CAB5390537.1 unnamed protein product [Rhizophagus irregularis]